MANSELILPGDFEKGKVHIVRGETLLAWRDALLRDRVVPGPGLKESGTPQGRIFRAVGSVSLRSGPFVVNEVGGDFFMDQGFMFWSRIIMILGHTDGEDPDMVIDGGNQPTEQAITFGGGAFNEPKQITDLAADDFGIYFETDANGNVTSAEMRWKEDVVADLQEFDMDEALGKYFQPVVRFVELEEDIFTFIPIVESAYFWKGVYGTAHGTTAPEMPPE